MSSNTLFDATNRDATVAPKVKQAIENTLLTLSFDEDDMRLLEERLNRLLSGTLSVMEVSQA